MTDRGSRMHEYLRSLEPEREPLLRELRAYAAEHYVPIVREETESILRTLCVLRKPDSILEIGTAIGYSTTVMARAVPEASITTIESFDKRIPLAEENLKRAGVRDRVRLIHADAGKALKALDEEEKYYDLIFLDAAKGQYLLWLPDIIKLMRKGAVLIADNVLQDETVLESRFALPHRSRSTHERMREFLYQIKHDPGLDSSVISAGDGISLSVRL